MKAIILGILVLGAGIFVSGLASGGATALAAGANHQLLDSAAHSGRSPRALPAALRPALYRALVKDAGSAYAVNEDGCAALAKQEIKACFDAHGAHFTGVTAVSLHLAAFGRGGDLSPLRAVRPIIHGNRVNYEHRNLTSWWRVLPMGFEQGFTVAERPSGHGELTLALAASRQDAGASLIRHSRESGNPVGKSIPTTDRDTKPDWIPASAGMTNNSPSRGMTKKGNDKALAWGKLRYGKLAVTDANGKLVPATLKSEGDRILIAVNDAHATYPLTVDPLVWIEQKVRGNDTMEYDGFGGSAALHGDKALIGADNGQAVYEFSKLDGTWTQTAEITPPQGGSFGSAVAFEGTVALISGGGGVYVYNYYGGNWHLAQTLSVDGGAIAIALDGPTAIVGGGGYGEGASVLEESNGAWSVAQILTVSGVTLGDASRLQWIGLDGNTAIIGAPLATVDGQPYRGAAFVFTKTNGTWSQTQELTVANQSANGDDEFGVSVSLDGSTALIGAYAEDMGNREAEGAAYVFTKTNGTWSQAQRLTDPAPPASCIPCNEFGFLVALDGNTAVIGEAFGTDAPNGRNSEAFVFTESNGTWSPTQALSETDPYCSQFPDGEICGDGFGRSGLVLDGNTVLVGADFNGPPMTSFGAAYFYGRTDLGLDVSAPGTVDQGQEYTSQTIATNDASAASPAVSATITVPAAASFVSATATQGSCSEASGVVTCDFGQIPGNAGMATANVTLKATGSAGTTIENVAGIAKAEPALTASAPTQITTGGACPAGYTEYDGSLAANQHAHSPIYRAPAGMENAILTAPSGFQLFAGMEIKGERKMLRIPGNGMHHQAPAGRYTWMVKAGDTGGTYTLCVSHP